MPPNTIKQDDEVATRDPAVKKYRPQSAPDAPAAVTQAAVAEVGGRKDGTEPTRFGDWEKQGRCIDF
jgi:hypothetical protein